MGFFPYFFSVNILWILWGKVSGRWWEKQELESECSKTGIGKNVSGKKRLRRKLRDQKISEWERLIRVTSLPGREKKHYCFYEQQLKFLKRKKKVVFLKKVNIVNISFKVFKGKKNLYCEKVLGVMSRWLRKMSTEHK